MPDSEPAVRTTPHQDWTVVGVPDPSGGPVVHSVEVFQGPDQDEPRLVIATPDLPQFVAGLVATVLPGDLTAEDDDEPVFSHFRNTRHRNWWTIGVTDSIAAPGVHTVEVFQGSHQDEPRFVIGSQDAAKFVADLVATAVPDVPTTDGD